jgi:hypothetical protein
LDKGGQPGTFGGLAAKGVDGLEHHNVYDSITTLFLLYLVSARIHRVPAIAFCVVVTGIVGLNLTLNPNLYLFGYPITLRTKNLISTKPPILTRPFTGILHASVTKPQKLFPTS